MSKCLLKIFEYYVNLFTITGVSTTIRNNFSKNVTKLQ
jgi:hypothetical protein